jgi:hypothetical protein
MLHAQFTYCGMALNCFDVNGEIYLTAASIAKALSKTPQQANNWLRRGGKASQGIDVFVPTRNNAFH